MARPREFDVDVALDRARDVFWANGFAATSIQDLVDALSVNRASLYATFGSKDELYRRAFEAYTTAGSQQADVLRDVEVPFREALRSYLVDLVSDPDGRGCFVVNAVCERAGDPAARRLVSDAVAGTRATLVDAFRLAASRGEAAGLPPEVAAETVLTLMQGLQVLTRVGGDEDDLGPVIDTVVDAVL